MKPDRVRALAAVNNLLADAVLRLGGLTDAAWGAPPEEDGELVAAKELVEEALARVQAAMGQRQRVVAPTEPVFAPQEIAYRRPGRTWKRVVVTTKAAFTRRMTLLQDAGAEWEVRASPVSR